MFCGLQIYHNMLLLVFNAYCVFVFCYLSFTINKEQTKPKVIYTNESYSTLQKNKFSNFKQYIKIG